MSKYISKIIKDKLDSEGIEFDYILYVPLHKRRERKRGFNQSKVIAKSLGDMIGIQVLNCIQRSKNTTRLFKLKDQERVRELKNAFILREEIQLCKGKKVLLIDDIFTTGSTVNEISKVLRIQGVDMIYVCTFLTRINCY
jgi:ComF family protein